jgi:hypothetical protein
LAASFQAFGNDFSPHENALQAEIGRTIPQSKATLNQFSKIGGIGVEDARTVLLASHVMLFRQECEGVGWLRDPSQVDHRS